ncbi:hypothetical protein NSQ29_20365 [Paenibacillus sp. FSL F4-0236]|uniref:hypothetical protein n=1 Tax=Paenibacillus sp. FSL F4-0236 TaxID=2954731 RepID=UPI00117F7D88
MKLEHAVVATDITFETCIEIRKCGDLKVPRKRLKPMKSLTNMGTSVKIGYLDLTDYNERFAQRVKHGFGDLEVKRC